MLALVAALLFAGYTLVYAAVANGGKFAAAPWEALRSSAYDGSAAGGPSPAGGGGSGVVGTIEGIAKGFLPFGGLLP